MKLVLLGLALSFGLSGYSQPGRSEETIEEWKNFDILADYLTRGSGKWIGQNSQYDPANERSPQSFGLWFERPIPGLMTLKIVAYFNDTVMVSSQGTFNWHPLEKKVIHTTSDRGNGYSEGVTSFPNDSSFISVMKIYRPEGDVYDHKDENFIVSADVHRNTSYGKDERGNWVERGKWVWKRE